MKRCGDARMRICSVLVVCTIIAGCGGDGVETTVVDAGATNAAASPPTGAQPAPSPAATPHPVHQSTQPAGFEALDVLLHTAFDDERSVPLFIGETTTGAVLSVDDGRYVAKVANGDWQWRTLVGMPPLADGVIQAEVALVGQGYGGLVARLAPVGEERTGMYVCLIDHSGWAGCVASHGESYADLFWSPIDDYTPGVMQTMRLTMVADRIELTINGKLIGSAVDPSISLGEWGVYAESLEDATATVTFDNLTLARVPPGVDPFGPVSD